MGNNKDWINGLGEVCKAHGRLRTGNELNHIVKIANGNNNIQYDLDNLIYVCTNAIEPLREWRVKKYVNILRIKFNRYKLIAFYKGKKYNYTYKWEFI